MGLWPFISCILVGMRKGMKRRRAMKKKAAPEEAPMKAMRRKCAILCAFSRGENLPRSAAEQVGDGHARGLKDQF